MPSSLPLEHWFIFQNERLLVIKNAAGNLVPTTAAIGPLKHELTLQHRVGQINHFFVYCAELNKDCALPDTIEALPFRTALDILGDKWYPFAAKSYAIITWDKNNQFCGRCSCSTKQTPGIFERHCPSCSLLFYPRISPSIIVRIRKGDQILMARSPHFIRGAYGLIAGFIEAGENVEEAIHREVQEEVGIKIQGLQYFGSQSWPFPDSLMLAFTAEHASGELAINHDEIEEAGWYRFDNLPGRTSSRISISRKLIDHFVAELSQKFA